MHILVHVLTLGVLLLLAGNDEAQPELGVIIEGVSHWREYEAEEIIYQDEKQGCKSELLSPIKATTIREISLNFAE